MFCSECVWDGGTTVVPLFAFLTRTVLRKKTLPLSGAFVARLLARRSGTHRLCAASGMNARREAEEMSANEAVRQSELSGGERRVDHIAPPIASCCSCVALDEGTVDVSQLNIVGDTVLYPLMVQCSPFGVYIGRY